MAHAFVVGMQNGLTLLGRDLFQTSLQCQKMSVVVVGVVVYLSPFSKKHFQRVRQGFHDRLKIRTGVVAIHPEHDNV